MTEKLLAAIYEALSTVRYPSRAEDPHGDVLVGMERVDTAVRTAIDNAMNA